jgi:hypothetical protein
MLAAGGKSEIFEEQAGNKLGIMSGLAPDHPNKGFVTIAKHWVSERTLG